MIKYFDLSKFTLRGSTLIEASAGSGKTHIIVMVYLRLLLGIGDNQHRIRPFKVEEILVVTFTKQATEELRKRIRKSIHALRCACILQHTKYNPFISEILEQIHDVNLAYNHLLRAEEEIDKASIFTIHSFCRHVVDRYPIELNTFFQYTILNDDEYLLQDVCNDFWRRHLYSLPTEIINIIQGYWKNPECLLREIYPYIHNQDLHIKTAFLLSEDNIFMQHKYIINCINDVKIAWKQQNKKLLNFLQHYECNRRIYNKKNIITWFTVINQWSKIQITKDYHVPRELERFKSSVIFDNSDRYTENSIQYDKLQHSLFKLIDILYRDIQSLKHLILSMAIRNIGKYLYYRKRSDLLISFNDLVKLVNDALLNDKSNRLVELIRSMYPIAMIDEFQDTDIYQCRIFHTLYFGQSQYGLLLIADPKQAIYSFRGADIFSYLQLRKQVDYLYTLNINWRASKNMMNAVNTLFQFQSNPFVFRDIPFIPMHVSGNNQDMRLVVQNTLYPAMYFCLHPDPQSSLTTYQKYMAQQCAGTICNLLKLANNGDVWIEKNSQNKKILGASDIVVLVRNYNEGSLIISALEKFQISSIYLSHSKNIFLTLEASDLLSILQAVLMPEDNNILRVALITTMFGYNAKKIESINSDHILWNKERDEFHYYRIFWKKYGVQPMLQEIIIRRHIMNQLLTNKQSERYLRNILYLSELCQKQSLELHDEYELVQWLKRCVQSPHMYHNHINDSLYKANIDHHVIRIMTIYQAKGLEFPLVFLPFMADFHEDKYPYFHDRENYQIFLDLSKSSQNFLLFDEEKLSENLRLLYVAITRAIYHCFIGIGSVCFKKIKKHNYHDLHRTALGYIIQNGISGNFSFLEECLQRLVTCAHGDIIYSMENRVFEPLNKHDDYNINIKAQQILFARYWKPINDTLLKVTSYSELNSFNSSSDLQSSLQADEVFVIEKNVIFGNEQLLSPHTFPKGVTSGKFLHYVLQEWNFTQPLHEQWLILQLNKYKIDSIWLPIVQSWMLVIINTLLNEYGLTLSQLSPTYCNTELQFYLSINRSVSAKEINEICQSYDILSNVSSPLIFSNILGMLHGFIDLVFMWQGRYYLLDYKSNWLGETCNNYTKSIIEENMIFHNYALQYQIYTLALHRFLRYKLKHYDYEKDFGGVYYLFLRGLDLNYPGYGVYFCRPKLLLINKLDQLLFH